MYVVEWRIVTPDGVAAEATARVEFDTLRAMWKYVKSHFPDAVIWIEPMAVPFARPYLRDVQAAKQAGHGLLIWSSRKKWPDGDAVGWILDEFEEEPEE